MAIRDYWLYQRRNVSVPWAIYFVKEYDRRHPSATTIDWTLYHEDIPNQTHGVSFTNLHYDSIKGYVDAITTEMSNYVSVEDLDREQIALEIERILFS